MRSLTKRARFCSLVCSSWLPQNKGYLNLPREGPLLTHENQGQFGAVLRTDDQQKGQRVLAFQILRTEDPVAIISTNNK